MWKLFETYSRHSKKTALFILLLYVRVKIVDVYKWKHVVGRTCHNIVYAFENSSNLLQTNSFATFPNWKTIQNFKSDCTESLVLFYLKNINSPMCVKWVLNTFWNFIRFVRLIILGNQCAINKQNQFWASKGSCILIKVVLIWFFLNLYHLPYLCLIVVSI